ncbi:TetR-like C-terminal domain-containing protein [Microbacterium album]|uniref:TetR family transcriptional regulator n=1 Tax=Microbacterium album TaxID=2053191 RepID=A0A917ICU0_9MICO|nr:TetR-like C-terminal domain-containing protein [Microbacterium album]GGH39886.1 TetR family transcriptional regulator [Microbacterium album]
MSGAGLSPAAVVDAAIAVIDERGLDALTLTAVAGHAGVAPPSLYKHVAGLGELRALIAARVLDEITGALTAAALGRSGEDAVAAMMHAYRDYAVGHPSRYAAVSPDPLHDPLLAEPARRQLDVILTVLQGCGVSGADAIHTTRALRATVHGFAHIESAGGFGMAEDVGVSFHRLVQAFVRTLSAPPSPEEKKP